MNDRRVLTGLLQALDAEDQATPVLRALDKREKQGDDVVHKEMSSAGLTDETIDVLLSTFVKRESKEATLQALAEAVGDEEEGQRGVAGLRRVLEHCRNGSADVQAVHAAPSSSSGNVAI